MRHQSLAITLVLILVSQDLRTHGIPTGNVTKQGIQDKNHLFDNQCPEEWFDCGVGKCIRNFWVCDGHFDCPGGEDEDNCPAQSTTEPTTQSTTQPTSQPTTEPSCTGFKCSNNKCIPSQSVCNGINDCGDDSDEKDCVSNGISSTLTSERTFFLVPVLMVALIKLIN